MDTHDTHRNRHRINSGGNIFYDLGSRAIFRWSSARCWKCELSLVYLNGQYPESCQIQLLFLSGVGLILGFEKSRNLFFQRQKLHGTALFFFGIFLVIVKWCGRRIYEVFNALLIISIFFRPKLGFLIEAFGFVNLFGNFIPHLIVVAKHLPVIGRILELPGIKQVAVSTINLRFILTTSEHEYQIEQVVDVLQQRGSSSSKAAAAV